MTEPTNGGIVPATTTAAPQTILEAPAPRAIVVFFCHDGDGRYVFHIRSQNCRDEQGRWCPGGGGIEYGETATQAVVREVKEEYGAAAIDIEFLGVREVIDSDKHIIALDHRVLVKREDVRLMEPEMALDIGWFSLSSLPAPIHSQIHVALSKYKGKL